MPAMVGDAPRADSRPLCRHGAGGGAQPLQILRKCTANVPHVYGGIQPACPAGSRPASVPGIGANSRGPFRLQRALRRNAPAVAARRPPRWRQGGISQAGFRAYAAAVPARVRHRAGYLPSDARQRRADRSCGRPSPLHYRCGAISRHCHGAALLYRCMTEGPPAKIPSAPQFLLISIWNNIVYSIVYFNRHGTTRAVGARPGQSSKDIHRVTSARALNQKTRRTRRVRGPHTERCVYRAT